MRRVLVAAIVLLTVSLCSVWAQDTGESDFAIRVAAYKSEVARTETKLIGLRNQFLVSLEARSYLAARKRYTEAIEYYYLAGDYEGAAERLLSLIEEPDVRKLEDYPAARFYLADSLYRIGAYNLAAKYLDQIIDDYVDPFWARAIIQRAHTASLKGEFDRLSELYTLYLQRFPADQDGSMIDYLMGKAYYSDGMRVDAQRAFERIPLDKSHAAMAQYFLGVMAVEEGRLDDAVAYFERAVEATKHANSANRREIYDLANMAAARVCYEQDRYSDALDHYFAVPGDSLRYPRVLYEVQWVYLTRNGVLLEELRQLELGYQQLAWQLESTVAGIKEAGLESFGDSVVPLVEEATKVQGDIEGLFDDLHGSLDRLKEEATSASDNMAKLAPDSPYLPEAVLMASRALSQLGDFDRAEKQFAKVEMDYSQLKRNLEVALTSGTQPPEPIPAWLRNDEELSEFKSLSKQAGELQALFDDTAKMEAEIQAEISTFSAETSPILEDAAERSAELKQQLAELAREGDSLLAELAKYSNVSDYNRWRTSIRSDRESAVRLGGELEQLTRQIEGKVRDEQRKLANLFAELSSPLVDLKSEFAMVSSEIDRSYAEANMLKMQSYVVDLENVVFEAALGQIDVTWQRAQAVSQDIRRILRAQDEEIRKYQLSVRGEE